MTDPESITADADETLRGRVVVVTGAAQGIGAAFARHLAGAGCRVAVVDLDGDRARAVADELGPDCLGISADVSNAASVAQAARAVEERFGHIDALINNAAIFSTLTMRPFEDIPLAEWDAVMAVNVKGVFLCIREFSRTMRQNGYGKVINISSATVPIGRPFYAHYVASKAAVDGLTKALANELGEAGIRVNAIAPGSTETEVPREAITPEIAARIVAGQALKRRQRPDDLVGVAAFLVSSASDFMTGQTIIVDGGVAFS